MVADLFVVLYWFTGAVWLRLKALTEGSRESYWVLGRGFKSAIGASGFHGIRAK